MPTKLTRLRAAQRLAGLEGKVGLLERRVDLVTDAQYALTESLRHYGEAVKSVAATVDHLTKEPK